MASRWFGVVVAGWSARRTSPRAAGTSTTAPGTAQGHASSPRADGARRRREKCARGLTCEVGFACLVQGLKEPLPFSLVLGVRFGDGLLVREDVAFVLMPVPLVLPRRRRRGRLPTMPKCAILSVRATQALESEVINVFLVRPVAECDPLLARPEATSLGVLRPELVLVDDGLGNL